jgi:hypothetical protein
LKIRKHYWTEHDQDFQGEKVEQEEPLAGRIMPLPFTEHYDNEILPPAKGFSHRELKGVTGIEACQCRKNRAQRNHIGCALLVWLCLKRYAKQMFATVYQLKQGLLDDYLRQQLCSPSLVFS